MNSSRSTYECGEEPIGEPWVRFRVAYYIFALVFVVFDVESVFLYPVGRHHHASSASTGSFEMAIFIGILVLGLAYAWRKGVLEVGVDDAVRADDRSGVLVAPLQSLMDWARGHSMWPLTFGTACCAIEMMTCGSARYDTDRFGIFFRNSPRQADCMIVAGTINLKMAPRMKLLYEQMAAPQVRHRDGLVRDRRRPVRRRATTSSTASTRSSRSTSTSPAARRGPRRSSTRCSRSWSATRPASRRQPSAAAPSDAP